MESYVPRPETPLLTVDIIIELNDVRERPIVFIERRFEPLGWALPGGFVDVGERVEDAARREAFEETGLRVELKCLLGVYSDPERDRRGHTVSAVYVAEASGEPTGGDDAARAQAFAFDSPPHLVFDHPQILQDYAQYRLGGHLPSPYGQSD